MKSEKAEFKALSAAEQLLKIIATQPKTELILQDSVKIARKALYFERK